MKMFSLFCLLALISLFVKAENTDLSAYDNAIYLGDAVAQVGNTAKIPVYAKHDIAQDGFQFTVKLPTGVTFVSLDPTNGYSGMTNTATVESAIYDGTGVNPFPAGTNIIGYMTVQVADDATIGENEMSVTHAYINTVEITDEIVTTLTIQRTALINDLPTGYGVEIAPGKVVRGEQTMKVYVKAATGIYNASFNIELPEGLYFMDEAEWDKANVKATFNSDAFTGAPTTSFTVNSTSSATVTISGAYSTKSKKHITATTTPVELLSFGPVYIATEEDVNDNDFVSENGPMPTEGLSTIKVSNISLSDIDKTNVYTGEYLASLGYGSNTTETEPIVYGDYDINSTSITDVLAATPNAISVDMSAAIVSENPALDDILVYGPTKTSYDRTLPSTYGTICLPYELTSGDAQYYTLSAVDGDKMTFTEATTVPANTPALVKGDVVSSADGYAYASTAGAEDAVNGLTFTGTYADKALTEGYYIKANKFYAVNGTATVPAFRGYFTGSISSVKAYSIYIQDATGIHNITDELSNEDIYNLQGIKLSKAQKGVNIIGGKKVLVK